jgi:hypothetical protein
MPPAKGGVAGQRLLPSPVGLVLAEGERSLSTTLRHPWVGFSEHLLVVAPRVGAG